MRPLVRAFVFLLAALAAMPAFAQPAEGAKRPRIGLVLGGGGARGAAHVGVLEVLEENRIPVDCIAGTSMGALVGGAYAAGVSPAEIQDHIRRTDWASIFDDSAGRGAVNLRRKQIDDRFYSGLEFGVTGQGLRFREGAFAGEKLKLFFNQLVRVDLGERSIEELAIPVTLLATDIGTGERVPMRSGSLTSAMRASMSVPGVIAPVMRHGRKLVDGGLVDNVPIAEVKELCKAEIVIAVNVGTPMLKPEEVSGVLSVVGQMVNLLSEQNVAQSLRLLNASDIYIRPELGTIGATDFTRQLEAVKIGRESALQALERLRPLAISPPLYRAWRAAVRLPVPHQAPVVDEVQVASTRFVNPGSIRGAIRQKTGEPLDAKALSEDIVLAYSQGDLQSLDYTVLRERDKTVLRITPLEKPWGPDYLRFGLNLSSDFRGESQYNLRAHYRRTWMNPLGAEWLSSLQLGSDQLISTELYQPLDWRHYSFARAYASIGSNKAGLFDRSQRLAEYRLEETRVGADGGVNLGIYGQARAGWQERRATARVDTGGPVFPEITQEVGGIAANLSVDTQDHAYFPTRGFRASADFFNAYRVSPDVERYGRLELKGTAAYKIGRFTAAGTLEGGHTVNGRLPLIDAFSLGGPRRLSAFAPNQFLAEEYGYGRLELQYLLTQPVPLVGLELIAGLTFEAGRVRKPITEPDLASGWLNSYGAYLAASTPLGPVYLGIADAKKGRSRFYLFIGTP